MNCSSVMALRRQLSCSLFMLAAIFVFLSPQVFGVDNIANGANLPKLSKSSILSLFNLNGRSKFWNEKIMNADFEDIERPDTVSTKRALTNFTMAASLADYLKLTPVDSIYLPLPINFIFIGFDGKGNGGVKIGEEELTRWFTQIDHILEHTRVPQVGEALTPFYRQRADGEQRHHLPLISHVHYNYSVHAIEMGEMVTKVFERALKVFSRRDDIKDTGPDSKVQFQVDVDSISYLFSSLVHYLQLGTAYNIFILNPKRDALPGPYGYRQGLSGVELQFLKEDDGARFGVLNSKPVKSPHPLDMDKRSKPLYERHPMLRFAWTTADTVDMDHWVDVNLDALNVLEKSMEGKTASEIVIAKAKEIIHKDGSDIASALRRALRQEENAGLHPDCLVDTWVGNERWAFVDLTAGPFSWGPAVGGVGVRTELSLPSIDKLSESLSATTDEEAHEDLSNLVQDRFSVFEEVGSPHILDTLLAEIDIYEAFSERHCEGRRIKVALCDELEERLEDLKEELKSVEAAESEEVHKKKAAEALRRIERWNLFSDAHQMQPIRNYSVARDWFLANLGAVLWSSMKHVVTPSTADGAFHYYEKLHFQIYIITQERIKHKELIPLDIGLLKESLAGVAIPGQKVQYSVKTLALSEDAALSMAFSVSRRAAVVPVLLVNGTHRTSTRLYLDSLILQDQLHHFSGSASSGGQTTNDRSVLEVPIFWFIQEGEALLIDKHQVAKALPDMVVVVQSSQAAWASHLQCNRNPILWDLSRPLKDAVAAVAEHVAGLMPSHFTFSNAHENADQDWKWAVGSHPFSNMASGWHVSSFQSDAIARSYIVSTLDESIETMNEAIKRLVKEQTSKESFEAFRRQEHVLLNSYNTVVNLWKRIARNMEDLHLLDAARLLHLLEDATTRFMAATNATIAELHPILCTRQRKVVMGYEMYLAIGMILSAMLALLWLKPRHSKPKIN
ncbi:hypothetical protein KP509_05G095700 [Ceratopteris richardii]|uniref:DUF7906 domain-containing protein n=4 Tax=Ceratopteris richardii TaxID=49495 RepID=A0A8T2UVM0_CERRI|nr:hypothetical protein KP509_05G095700 [Ceratopteris richardii]